LERITRMGRGLLASDISLTILNEARTDIPHRESEGYGDEIQDQTFHPVGERQGGHQRRTEIHGPVQEADLMRENLPFKGKFDVIFCRNVMIYFDNFTRPEPCGQAQ